MMASAWLTPMLDQFFDQKRRGDRQVGAAEIQCAVAAKQQQDDDGSDVSAALGFAPLSIDAAGPTAPRMASGASFMCLGIPELYSQGLTELINVTSEVEERIHRALQSHPLEQIENGYRLIHPAAAGVSILRLLPGNAAGDGSTGRSQLPKSLLNTIRRDFPRFMQPGYRDSTPWLFTAPMICATAACGRQPNTRSMPMNHRHTSPRRPF